jgi:glutathione synthase/RimK-type ligase-like ATP-grasp enzyme
MTPSLLSLSKEFFRRAFERKTGGFPNENQVPLNKTERVILNLSNLPGLYSPRTYAQEASMAQVLSAKGETYALTNDPSQVFGKKVYWSSPSVRGFVKPKLWNYSVQLFHFIKGLEEQGNELFCSSSEILYWENKGYMHRKFEEHQVPTPKTILLTEHGWKKSEMLDGPVVIKEEHSAGSAGIHYFDEGGQSSDFLESYAWHPGETLVCQSVVPGASKDLRLTLVAGQVVPEGTYWRVKDPAASGKWTTTASTYNSSVKHDDIPLAIVEHVGKVLEVLQLRTAGVDIMWENDDLKTTPLILEVSPLYQPNPPKPKRYDSLTYKQYKKKLLGPETYLDLQFETFKKINGIVVESGFF